MHRYKITIELVTDNGNPAKWDWRELLDEDRITDISVQGLGAVMSLMGYELDELKDASYAIASVLTTVNSDDDPFLFGNLCVAKDFIDSVIIEVDKKWAEGEE